MSNKQEQGKPVAQTLKDAVFTVLEGFTLDRDVRKILESAYYTTPQQRKPLTDEQIRQGAHPVFVDELDDFRMGVRWAEAVHGIKE